MATNDRPSGVSKYLWIDNLEITQNNDNLLKGIEQVTFPVISPPSLHVGNALGAAAGCMLNVLMLSVSISNTLFDSCTTLRRPIASSNFCFHSVRPCTESAYSVQGPPNRALC